MARAKADGDGAGAVLKSGDLGAYRGLLGYEWMREVTVFG
jgi:hypothetical protein